MAPHAQKHWFATRPLAALGLAASLLLAGCAHAPSADRTSEAAIGARAADTARAMVGKPYRYGGKSPRRGFDCSGLVYFSFAQAGRRVPRDTRSQMRAAHPIPYRDMRKGDLIFFAQSGRRYSHVGIYLGKHRFVHAPSTGERVRVDSLDNPYWRRHFVDARRFF